MRRAFCLLLNSICTQIRLFVARISKLHNWGARPLRCYLSCVCDGKSHPVYSRVAFLVCIFACSLPLADKHSSLACHSLCLPPAPAKVLLCRLSLCYLQPSQSGKSVGCAGLWKKLNIAFAWCRVCIIIIRYLCLAVWTAVCRQTLLIGLPLVCLVGQMLKVYRIISSAVSPSVKSKVISISPLNGIFLVVDTSNLVTRQKLHIVTAFPTARDRIRGECCRVWCIDNVYHLVFTQSPPPPPTR